MAKLVVFTVALTPRPQHGLDVAVARRPLPGRERHPARPLEPRRGVAPGQPEHGERGVEALLVELVAGEHPVHQLGAGGPDPRGPGADARRVPVRPRPALGHVRGQGVE